MCSKIIGDVSAEKLNAFEVNLSVIGCAIHANAKVKGFWDNDKNGAAPNPSEKLMLTVGELAELQEALRDELPDGTKVPSVKIPGFSNEEEETADAVIRLLDFAQYRGLRLGAAILAKMRYNESRPHKHGRSF